MATKLSTSAALRYTEEQLGGPCTEVESYPVAQAGSNIVLAQGNGDRVGLLIMVLDTNFIIAGLTASVATGKGIQLPANGGFFACNVRDDFTLPSREWVCRSNTGSSQCYVLEIIRYRPNEETS